MRVRLVAQRSGGRYRDWRVSAEDGTGDMNSGQSSLSPIPPALAFTPTRFHSQGGRVSTSLLLLMY